MNAATITKTLNKVAAYKAENTEYSLGFCRLTSLSRKAKKAFDLACLLDGMDVNEIHKKQKSFLQSLSEQEFKNWLAING